MNRTLSLWKQLEGDSTESSSSSSSSSSSKSVSSGKRSNTLKGKEEEGAKRVLFPAKPKLSMIKENGSKAKYETESFGKETEGSMVMGDDTLDSSKQSRFDAASFYEAIKPSK
ncbi:unnamed protein product [Microthlaspi erraticum]|uniref:Uncharacterized protein n=1 Tax=Microthlaspi erraticum TaxID=1685480 RepID=A0A6D2IBM0_9BRAS|nr:unnamed protein product [Microthlaspi erraticum]